MQLLTHESTRKLDETSIRRTFVAGPMGWLDVGHTRLAYWRFGTGPDLVFVHGWPLHAATFRRILPVLARDFTCHLFDLPGAGRSRPTPETPFGLVEHAETLRRAVDRLDLPHYALLAHDSGAVFARLVAASDARVRALVMGNTEIPGHRPKVVEMYVALGKIPGATALTRLLMHARRVRHSSIGFGGCFTDVSYADGDFHELFVAPILESSDAMRGQMGLVRHLDFSVVDRLDETHARIQIPTFLCWGEHDPFFPLAKAQAMLAGFAGGAELDVIADARLFAHEDHAPRFASSVSSFLARVHR
jgi:pimeloyl-ACP methyl ester carboxylesterase